MYLHYKDQLHLYEINAGAILAIACIVESPSVPCPVQCFSLPCCILYKYQIEHYHYKHWQIAPISYNNVHVNNQIQSTDQLYQKIKGHQYLHVTVTTPYILHGPCVIRSDIMTNCGGDSTLSGKNYNESPFAICGGRVTFT